MDTTPDIFSVHINDEEDAEEVPPPLPTRTGDERVPSLPERPAEELEPPLPPRDPEHGPEPAAKPRNSQWENDDFDDGDDEDERPEMSLAVPQTEVPELPPNKPAPRKFSFFQNLLNSSRFKPKNNEDNIDNSTGDAPVPRPFGRGYLHIPGQGQPQAANFSNGGISQRFSTFAQNFFPGFSPEPSNAVEEIVIQPPPLPPREDIVPPQNHLQYNPQVAMNSNHEPMIQIPMQNPYMNHLYYGNNNMQMMNLNYMNLGQTAREAVVVKLQDNSSWCWNISCCLLAFGFLFVFLFGFFQCATRDNRSLCFAEIPGDGPAFINLLAFGGMFLIAGSALYFACPSFEWGACITPGMVIYRFSRLPVCGSFWGLELANTFSNLLFSLFVYLPVFNYALEYELEFSPYGYYLGQKIVPGEADSLEQTQGRIIISIVLFVIILVHIHKSFVRNEHTYVGVKKFWSGSVILLGMEDIIFTAIKTQYRVAIADQKFGPIMSKGNASLLLPSITLVIVLGYFMGLLRFIGSAYVVFCYHPVYTEGQPSNVLLIEYAMKTKKSNPISISSNDGRFMKTVQDPETAVTTQIMIIGSAEGVRTSNFPTLINDKDIPSEPTMQHETKIRRLNQFERLALRNTAGVRIRVIPKTLTFDYVSSLVSLIIIILFIAALAIGGAPSKPVFVTLQNGVAEFLGILALVILACAACIFCCIKFRAKGYLVQDVNFYEARIQDPYFSGLRVLEATDWVTDVVTIGLIYSKIPFAFQVLCVISIVLTTIGNVVFYSAKWYFDMPKTFENEAGRLAFGLFLAAVEDIILIPLNILFLVDSGRDSGISVADIEIVAVGLSAVVGMLVLISRFWGAFSHFCCAYPVYPGDDVPINQYIQLERKGELVV